MDDPEHAALRQELYVKVRQAYGIDSNANGTAVSNTEAQAEKSDEQINLPDLDTTTDDSLTDEPIV